MKYEDLKIGQIIQVEFNDSDSKNYTGPAEIIHIDNEYSIRWHIRVIIPRQPAWWNFNPPNNYQISKSKLHQFTFTRVNISEVRQILSEEPW